MLKLISKLFLFNSKIYYYYYFSNISLFNFNYFYLSSVNQKFISFLTIKTLKNIWFDFHILTYKNTNTNLFNNKLNQFSFMCNHINNIFSYYIINLQKKTYIINLFYLSQIKCFYNNNNSLNHNFNFFFNIIKINKLLILFINYKNIFFYFFYNLYFFKNINKFKFIFFTNYLIRHSINLSYSIRFNASKNLIQYNWKFI